MNYDDGDDDINCAQQVRVLRDMNDFTLHRLGLTPKRKNPNFQRGAGQ